MVASTRMPHQLPGLFEGRSSGGITCNGLAWECFPCAPEGLPFPDGILRHLRLTLMIIAAAFDHIDAHDAVESPVNSTLTNCESSIMTPGKSCSHLNISEKARIDFSVASPRVREGSTTLVKLTQLGLQETNTEAQQAQFESLQCRSMLQTRHGLERRG